ncbi:formin-like protein 3 [Selaginella moellendorffii]|nr:formin-like protein 3 [Selaginella moellendorffii]|eukprot:XP_024531860.1 formin-like protein 3 [Selaginella moellendorffii]
MQTVLSLGNALNQGTARGAAIGFRLDSLLKLTETRARNSRTTLLHYLCKIVSEKMPEILDFDKELPHLEAATKIQLKALAEEMQAVSKGLEKVEQELTASENDGAVSDGFRKSLKSFLDTAEAEVRTLASLYSEVGHNADSLARYFNEDPARCPFEQAVSIIFNFIVMFKRALEENSKLAEMERKKAEKEADKGKVLPLRRELDGLLSPRQSRIA